MISLVAATALAAPCGTGNSLVEISPTLALGVCSDTVVRVVRTPNASPTAAARMASIASLMVDPSFPSSVPKFTVDNSSATQTVVTTSTLKVAVDTTTLEVAYADAATSAALTGDFGHRFTPATDPASASATWSVEQSFSTTADEQLYGGGEFQNGLVGIKGVPLQLV